MSKNTTTDLAVVILAAGMGTRMKSTKQKILHDVGGAPMVMHVVDAARAVAQYPPVLVIGDIGGDRVKALVGEDAQYAIQEEQLGTGHAAMMATDLLQGTASQVAVTYGDMPLLKAESLASLAQQQAQSGAAVVMLTVMGEPTSSFGRVMRNEQGHVIEIVEVAEAKRRPNTEEILNNRELNVGVYCFDAAWMWDQLPNLPLRQARSGVEYYLTDLIEAAVAQERKVEAIVISDEDECLGAGTRAELVDVEKAFRRRANRRWLDSGVTLVDPDTIYIDQTVTIGQDTVIWPNTYLQGNTTIGKHCVIGPNAVIRDATLDDGVRAEQTVIDSGASVAENTIVPPFSHLTM